MADEVFPARRLCDVGVVLYDCEHATPPDEGVGYPYLAIPNIRDGRLDLATVRRISRAQLARWNRRVVPSPGDIVVTRRGRVGDSAPIPQGLECAIGQNLVILRSEGSEVDQGYLRWAVRGPAWHREVQRMLNVGAVFDSLNCSDIPRMRISIPPIAEQRAITEVLGALDDKIESNRRVANLLHEVGALQFAAMPFDVRSLADVALVTMGSSPPGDTYNEVGEGVPFYQGVRDFGIRFPTRRVWCSAPKRTADRGDTLISVRAPVGRLNRAREHCCIGRGIAAARSRTPSTLYYALCASDSVWEPYHGEGTVFGAINRDSLRTIALKWPLDAEEAEQVLRSVDDRLMMALEENETLTALRDALVPAFLSGRLRVKDADQFAEVVV